MNFIEANWPAPPGILGGCSTRSGGVSDGEFESLNVGSHVGDRLEHVAENRNRLVNGCGLPEPPRWLRQVHGNKVALDPDVDTEADAAVTREPGLVCAVMVADCLPGTAGGARRRSCRRRPRRLAWTGRRGYREHRRRNAASGG